VRLDKLFTANNVCPQAPVFRRCVSCSSQQQVQYDRQENGDEYAGYHREAKLELLSLDMYIAGQLTELAEYRYRFRYLEEQADHYENNPADDQESSHLLHSLSPSLLGFRNAGIHSP
jgi:hypothetical protein